MTGPVLWALLGHWRRNPLQLFTVLAGLALATALWSGVQAINAEARASYRLAADMLGAADRAQCRGPCFGCRLCCPAARGLARDAGD